MNIIFNHYTTKVGGVETFLEDLASLLCIDHDVYFLVDKPDSYIQVRDKYGRFSYLYKKNNTPIEYQSKREISIEKDNLKSQLDLNKNYFVISLYFFTFQYSLAIFGDDINFKLLHFWNHPQNWINELYLIADNGYVTNNDIKKVKKYLYQKNLLIELHEKFADYYTLNHSFINYNNWFYGTDLILNPNSFAFPVLSKCSKSNRHFNIQTSKTFKILWVGRFAWFKIDAINYIIKSLEYLSANWIDYLIELTIVGYGDKKYEKMIIDFSNNSTIKINLIGKVDYEKLPQLFDQYDVGIAMGLTVRNMADCSLPAILIDQIDHDDIFKPSCDWLFDSEIDDLGDGHYQLISGRVQNKKTLIDLLNSILINELDLGYLSKKSKKFFDLNYSMENNLEKFFKFLNGSNFNGTKYKVYSRPFIIKVLYKLYKKIPINQRMFLRAIISSTLLKFR